MAKKLNIDGFLNGIFNEGLVDNDIAKEGETVDTTKADGVDFEDTLSGVVERNGDPDISDLSDRTDCGSFDGICKESVVNVDGKKYRVSVSVTKLS